MFSLLYSFKKNRPLILRTELFLTEYAFSSSTTTTYDNNSMASTMMMEFKMPDLMVPNSTVRQVEHQAYYKNKIIQWNKKIGDKINPGDQLCKIDTPFLSYDFENENDAYLADILHPTGSINIPKNETLAIMVKTKEQLDDYLKFSKRH